MKTPIYLINLDESTERLANVDAQLKAHNISYERVSAVLGKDLTDEDVANYYNEEEGKKYYYRSLSRGEVGCFLSHRLCWKKILESGAPFGIILEDDLQVTGNVHEAIGLIEQLDFAWDLVKLAPYNRKVRKEVLSHKLNENFSLVIHNKVMAGTPATIYSREGARKLLKATEKFYRPIDTDIQHFWEKDVEVWSLSPYVFQQNLDSESTLTATRKHNTKRHWLRKTQQVSEFFNNRKAVKKQVKSFLNRS